MAESLVRALGGSSTFIPDDLNRFCFQRSGNGLLEPNGEGAVLDALASMESADQSQTLVAHTFSDVWDRMRRILLAVAAGVHPATIKLIAEVKENRSPLSLSSKIVEKSVVPHDSEKAETVPVVEDPVASSKTPTIPATSAVGPVDDDVVDVEYALGTNFFFFLFFFFFG
jgi:hypothetical protein